MVALKGPFGDNLKLQANHMSGARVVDPVGRHYFCPAKDYGGCKGESRFGHFQMSFRIGLRSSGGGVISGRSNVEGA